MTIKMNNILPGSMNRRNILAIVTLSVLTGGLPIVLIGVRQRMIDAALGVGEIHGGRVALVSFGILLVVCLVEQLLGDLDRCLQAIRKSDILSVTTRVRLEKASRVRFQVSETEEFHNLFHQAGQIPEVICDIYGAYSNGMSGGIRIVSTLAVVVAIRWEVAVLVAVLLAAGIILQVWCAGRNEGFWQAYMGHMRRSNYLSKLLVDRQFADERKLFGYFSRINREFGRAFRSGRNENKALGRSRFWVEAVVEFFSAGYLFAVPVLLLPALFGGRMSLGMYVSLFTALGDLLSCAKALLASAFQMKLGSSKLGAWGRYMDLPEEGIAEDMGYGVPAELEDVVFEDVYFRYPGTDKYVLQGANFRLSRGRHYALVGENGAGKSTVVKLLLGLYEPEKGRVLVNGIPLARIPKEKRAELFCAVFQDFYEYPLSVRETVSMGKGTLLADGQIDGCMEAVQLAHRIRGLGKGYDSSLTGLKEDGVNFSGGEWQKLAIARCILSGAQAALLDEPNAALDPISEMAVYQAYGELLRNRMTLFISHRLGSVQTADEILVLIEGRIAAQASHSELMELSPYYRDLYLTQRRQYYGEK